MSTVTLSAGLSAPRLRAPRVLPATPRASAPLRLTRRGRLILTVVALLALLTVGALLTGGLATAGTELGAAATAERVTGRPGETLWAIAEREAPGVDPRDTVAAILELNRLDSSAGQAGSVLLLP